jgi:hypothetical protein
MLNPRGKSDFECRSFVRSLLPIALVLCACPPPPPLPDSGTPDGGNGTSDAGHDAGQHPHPDAGHDAGLSDVPITAWCDDQAIAQCARDQRCGRIDAMTWSLCLEAKHAACDSTSYIQSVNAGALGYDPAKAADCLNAYAHGNCEDLPAACSFVFTGKTEPDGGCVVPDDCDPTQGFCDLYDELCPHHCSAFVGSGASCDDPFSPRCGATLGCEYPDDGGFLRVCVPLVQEGQHCRSFNACAPGLICEPGADGGQVCLKQYATDGQPCGVTNGFPFCTDNLFCHQMLVLSGTPPPGTCERRGGIGDVCYGYGTCLPSLRCSSAVGGGTCQPFAALGEACSNNFYGGGECQDGLFCDKVKSRCVPLPRDGGDCGSTGSEYQCATGYTCDYDVMSQDYVCHALKADGETCSYDGQCLSNECVYGVRDDGGFAALCVRCSQVADGG